MNEFVNPDDDTARAISQVQVPPRPGHAPDENRRVCGLSGAGTAYVTFGCTCGDERCDWVGIAHLDNYKAPAPDGPVCLPA